MVIINAETKLKNDLEIINLDILTKQKDKKYCKFSRILNSVIVIGLSKEQYINYWKAQWNSDKEKQKIIIAACEAKFKIGLTSKEEMIKLIENSDDKTKDKENALKKL